MIIACSWTKGFLAAALLGVALLPASAGASPSQHLQDGLQSSTDQGLVGFYRARANRPLWTEGGKVHASAQTLSGILRRASLDGMENGDALAVLVDQAVARALSGQPGDLANAELVLSRAWVAYVQTLRRPVEIGMVYSAGAVSPAAPFTAQVLGAAGNAPDLAAHLVKVSELNPVYSQLRAGLAAWRDKGRSAAVPSGLTDQEIERRLRLNLDRARALPLAEDGRFILVDTASARMFLYENGRVRDSMKVIIGKAVESTPMVAGMIQNAVLNPYWNVPPDLVRKRAAGVVKSRGATIPGKNFELLSDWSTSPQLLDAKSMDWAAVASGAKELRLRQLPGPGNAMGAMKFNFPNDYGIFLHDTPDKTLFAKADRRLSSGCIRVEDARRLGNWIFGRELSTTSKAPEQVVPVPTPMPVYVTYFTAGWDGQRFTFIDDGYNRDAANARLTYAAPGYNLVPVK